MQRIYLTIIFGFIFLIGQNLISQPKPKVDFSFNNGDSSDAIGGLKTKLVNVSFTTDRFGNQNHALYLFGNENSFINLGTNSRLKPKRGSIAMWVKIENALWYGSGYEANPLLLTKSSKEDDFFEAYVFYYMYETKKVVAMSVKDSANLVFIPSKGDFELRKWNHLVMAYDRDTFSFYINGELENKFQKGFDVDFLETDSVLIGTTANKKNKRFFSGSVDDILFYDKVLSPADVKLLYQSPNPNRQAIIWNRLMWFGIWTLVAGLIYLVFRWRLKRQIKREREQIALQTRLLETELRVNRALMDPHFIFNSLNAIRDLVHSGQDEQAGDYLLKFSKLLRKILDTHIADTISLEDEIDILRRYMDIEQLRFVEKFDFNIHVDPNLNPAKTFIPLMMIQPFVENSIWHGLIRKASDRKLEVSFKPIGTDYLLCTIDDNGLGRRNKEPQAGVRKSLATVFVKSRLELYNKMHNLNCGLNIIDKPDESGTKVEIQLPLWK